MSRKGRHQREGQNASRREALPPSSHGFARREGHDGIGGLGRVVGEGEGDEKLESKVDNEDEESRQGKRDRDEDVEELGNDLGDRVRNRVCEGGAISKGGGEGTKPQS